MITGGQHDDDRRSRTSAPEPPSALALDSRLDLEADSPDHAHWGRRVVAAVLDGGLLGLITWLAFPVQPVVAPLPVALTASGTSAPVTAGVWTSSPVVVGAVVVVALMQAYLGSSPGKLAVGIALVRADDHRPGGLLRMLGREVMHVVDLLLLIGYLRPLWHRRRQTFADSIAATVVLRTRAPLPYLLARPVLDRPATPAAGAPWQLPSPPRWRTVTTAVATAACVVGAVFAVSGESGPGGVAAASCTVVEPRAGALQLTGIDVEVRGQETRTRLGLTRALVPENPGLVVGWGWYGEWSSDDDLRYRVTVRDQSGTERSWQYAYRGDGLQVPPGQQTVPGRTDAVLIPPAALAGLGDDVTVEADAVLDGVPLTGCTVGTSLAPAR